MVKISLCMIVKDEEAVLARCLNSVKDCVDEIVIADTGSQDGTIEIAKSFTPNVYPFAWTDDFSTARNFSFSKATGEYLLWLDADDFIDKENGKRLKNLKKQLERERPDFVKCPYDTSFDVAGKPLFTFFRERLIRNCAQFRWEGCVHECIAPAGKVILSDFRVRHLGSEKPRADRNLQIYRRYLERGNKLNARDKFYYGRELYYHKLYTEAAALLNDAIADEFAWYVNRIEACALLSKCCLEQGDRPKAVQALLQSFRFGEPRASVLCALGGIFREENKLREAAFWYKAALSARDHSEEGDFDQPADRTFRPLLELVCCCYALGDTTQAIEYHKRAEKEFPDHPSVQYNRTFFQTKNLL